jgi:HK97 family phage prohead protease
MAQETITLQDGTVVQVADFDFGFTLDSKAMVEEADDGTIIIEGYASDFGLDRQDEAFEPGAFEEGIKSFMDNPVLLYHHKTDTALGQVEKLVPKPQGLWVRARVDKPEPNTIIADYARKIKSGVLRGFSVGGKFFRRMTPSGPRIFKCDLREVSVTPLPVNPRTLFAVAGKAFDNMEGMDSPVVVDTTDLEERIEKLDALFTTLEGKASSHPDGPKIAALLYHMQQIHTLATDTKQDAQSDDTKAAASDIAKHVEKHTATLHRLAAKHGPLPNTYGGSLL